jgi:transposase InsO family protein
VNPIQSISDIMPASYATTSYANILCQLMPTVKSVHADNAAEFIDGDFNSCLREQGIKYTSSAPYSPKSNSQKTSIRFCLLAFVAFSITLTWIRLCGEKLPTTPYINSTSRRQYLLATSLRMKQHMALCLM